jgi:DnaJ-like protein
MTERKPPGISFETWVDRQIREAAERGAFDDLPGAGKPIPGLDRPFSGERWAAEWARREGAETEAMLPEPLRLRKEAERLPDTVRDLDSEEAVRAAARELNQRIVDWIRRPSGPRVVVTPVDPDRLVEQWRANRPTRGVAPPPTGTAQPATDEQPSWRFRWWRRRKRRSS